MLNYHPSDNDGSPLGPTGMGGWEIQWNPVYIGMSLKPRQKRDMTVKISNQYYRSDFLLSMTLMCVLSKKITGKITTLAHFLYFVLKHIHVKSDEHYVGH